MAKIETSREGLSIKYFDDLLVIENRSKACLWTLNQVYDACCCCCQGISHLFSHSITKCVKISDCKEQNLFKNKIDIKPFFAFFCSSFFYFLTHDWFYNHLKHLGSNKLGVLIRPVWHWHHFHPVYWRRGSNQRPFDTFLLPTRPHHSLWCIFKGPFLCFYG